VGLDISKTVSDVRYATGVLTSYKEDEQFESVFKATEDMARSLEVQVCHHTSYYLFTSRLCESN